MLAKLHLLITAVFSLTTATRPSCTESNWPVFVGGETGLEDVRCIAYDANEELIIVLGVTNSSDFAPTTLME